MAFEVARPDQEAPNTAPGRLAADEAAPMADAGAEGRPLPTLLPGHVVQIQPSAISSGSLPERFLECEATVLDASTMPSFVQVFIEDKVFLIEPAFLKLHDTTPFNIGIHPNVSCDKSKMQPIVGIRYKLRSSGTPSYDLCQAEYDKLSEDDKLTYEAIAPRAPIFSAHPASQAPVTAPASKPQSAAPKKGASGASGGQQQPVDTPLIPRRKSSEFATERLIMRVVDVLGPAPEVDTVPDLKTALTELDQQIGLAEVKQQVHCLPRALSGSNQ